jgi:hypothetical protein
VSHFLRTFPVAALLGAWVAFAPAEPLDPAWTSTGFAASLQSAAGDAQAELREAPEVARARISVRSVADYAPLRVEAAIDWKSEVSDDRKDALLAAVRSRFDSFARVDVVLSR